MSKTLQEARDQFQEKVREEGAKCPCCDRWSQRYRRKLTNKMASHLIRIYLSFNKDYGHVQKVAKLGGDYAKLRFWGFIEEDPERLGYWRVTNKGEEWLLGDAPAREVAVVLFNELEYMDGRSVFVYDQLTDFDLEELMNA